MSRTVRRTLASVALFFLIFPLTLEKPGWPPSLKADEPAYAMMAESLAYDGDLELTLEDVRRVLDEFPYGPVSNLIVMTTDGWHTVHYGKPYVYSLCAAPFVGLFGANGLLFFNMLLTLLMVWMGGAWLARFNPEGRAYLFSAGFFFLSAGFGYVFWLQPEVFNMASVMACLFVGFHLVPDSGGRRALMWAALSGAALAPAVYNKPMLALLGLPVLWLLVSKKQWRRSGAWLGGAALAMGVIAGLAVVWTGEPTPYLGVTRQGVTLCHPDEMPIEPVPAAEVGVPDPERPTGGAWSWIFRIPDTSARELTESLTYFLVGRHTGLFLYFPFTLLCLILFLAHGRSRGPGWVLLGCLAATALFFVLFIPYNWQGGGGFLGNRYYVNAVPGFLFLVTRIRARGLVPVGWALGGLLLAPMLFSPFARTGAEPTLQSHVRNFPYPWFPLELSLREVPGYQRLWIGDRRFIGRRDVVLPRGEHLWLRGASEVEVQMMGPEPLERAVFQVQNVAPDQRIEIELGDDRRVLEFGADVPPDGEIRRVELVPGEPDKIRRQGDTLIYVYRLHVETDTGRVRKWVRQNAPQRCDYFAYNESWRESFFLGASFLYLGDGAGLEHDLYEAEWREAGLPETLTVGDVVDVPVAVVNRSEHPWPSDGPTRVKVSYHWTTPDGEPVVRNGERTDLPEPVEPGAAVRVTVPVTAPEEPGTYVLEMDLIREHVAWFGDRGATTRRTTVEVRPRP